MRHPGLKLKIPAWVFCMSWCPDLEFRGTYREATSCESMVQIRLEDATVREEEVRAISPHGLQLRSLWKR